MKVAIRCLNCSQVIRFYGSYSVRLKERTTNVLTGEIKEQDIVGKVCKNCARLAGYKIKE